MSDQNFQTIAVFGCGTIGASWAGLFAARGLNVRLYDVSAEALASGQRKAFTALDGLLAAEEDAERLQDARGRIRVAKSAQELLDGADFVQESVLERYGIKREAHEVIERHAAPEAVIASSSSGLLAHRMQEGLAHPERFVVAHPFNPPHLIPLVELVPGPRTSEDVLMAAHGFYASLKKVPVIVRKEVPGHLANRLAAAVWREAIDLVANGVASLEDVDKALYAGPGLRWAFMGQHLIYHLNGGQGGYEQFFEHFGPQLESYMKDMASWTEVPESARREVLAQMRASVAGRDMAELEKWRDERLAKLVHVLYAEEELASSTK